jgi:hypothetical protein
MHSACQNIHDGQEARRDFRFYSLKLIVGHKYFSNDAREKIIADLSPNMPDLDIVGYFRSQPSIFTDYDFLVLAEESATRASIGLLGSRMMSTASRRFLYIRTAQIVDTFRSSRLYARMQSFMISGVSKSNGGLLPELVAMKTHNPRAFVLMKRCFREYVYPRIPGPQSFSMSEIATDIASSMWPLQRFSVDTGVIHGVQAAISPNFLPPASRCRDDDVNDYFQSNLTRDDQILCVVHLPVDVNEALCSTSGNAAMT